MPSFLFLAAQIAVAIEQARIAAGVTAEQLGLALAALFFPDAYAADLRRTVTAKATT